MTIDYPEITQFDPKLAAALQAELRRQEDFVELIASENYASRRVLEAQGSVLTNKYAEGYPGRRYYGGCEHVDVAESLAIERASRLFGADYVNVQPHSGSQANTAAYLALRHRGEPVRDKDLSDGGHIAHGSPVNISGKLFKVSSYGLDAKTELIDYNQLREQALKHRPRMIVGGFSAYSRVADWNIFRDVADEVGAWLMVDMAHVAGLVAAGEYPNPVPLADVVTTTTHKTLRGPRGGLILARQNPEVTKRLRSLVFPGTQGGPLMHVIAAKAVALEEALQPGFRDYQRQVKRNAAALAEGLLQKGLRIVSGKTENHLFLVDLGQSGPTGAEAEAALDQANITVNKNAVPNDPRPPMVTSGLRLGTPACTTRGFGEEEMTMLVDAIAGIVSHPGDQALISRVREQVLETCRRFPVYA